MESTDRPSRGPSSDADVALYYGLVEQLTCRGASGVEARLFTADFVEHDIAGDGRRDDFVARLDARRARFPDGVWTIELLTGIGELVICHTTMSCPSVLGWETVVLRMDAGLIAECWRVCNERARCLDARERLEISPSG